MKSWISICNQGVIDRTYFIFFELVVFYYVLNLMFYYVLNFMFENIIKDDELKKDEIRTINNTLITNGYPRFHRKRRPTVLALKANPNKRKS